MKDFLKNALNKRPDLLNGSIVKTLVVLSLPILLSHILQTLYTLADAFWLGRLGKEALSAPTISFIIVFVFISLAAGLAGGGMTLLGQYKGSGNKNMVNKVAENTMLLVFVISGALSVIGYIFTPQILTLMNTPQDAFYYTSIYMRITFLGMPFVFGYYMFQGLMQGYGDTVTPLKLSGLTVLLNIILDPILIFGIKGVIPPLSVAGAAIATIFSQSVSAFIGIMFLASGKYGIKISFRHYKPDFSIVRDIFKIGVPMSFGQIGTSLGFMLLMGIVNSFGSAVVSAFGIGDRLISLASMPAMSMQMGASAMIAQNMGAGNVKRSEEIVWKAVKINFIMTFVLTTLLFLFGNLVTKFFINDPEVIRIGGEFFRITAYSVLMFTIMMIFMSPFQGSGNTMPVLVMQIIRLWGLRIPLVYLFAYTLKMGSNGIFWGMFASNIGITIISYFWFKTGSWKKSAVSLRREEPVELEGAEAGTL